MLAGPQGADSGFGTTAAGSERSCIRAATAGQLRTSRFFRRGAVSLLKPSLVLDRTLIRFVSLCQPFYVESKFRLAFSTKSGIQQKAKQESAPAENLLLSDCKDSLRPSVLLRR